MLIRHFHSEDDGQPQGGEPSRASDMLDRYGRVCSLSLDGCTLVATTGDHIVPKSERPDLAYDVTNGRPACRECNSSRGTDALAVAPTLDARKFFESR